MGKKNSPIALKRRKEKRKKIALYGGLGLVGALVLTCIIWYSLFFFGVVKYTPIEVLTGKHKPHCVVENYKGLTYTEVSDEVTEADYTDYYNTMLANQPNYTKDDSRDGSLVRSGDVVNIDYEGKIDGVAFDGGTAAGYDLVIGSGSFIEGFEDALIGQTVGTTVDIDVTFPEDYSVNTDLAGQPAVFTVTINYIDQVVDEVTDDYIAKYTDYATVAEFESSYLDDYLTKKAADNKKESEYEDVIEQLINNTKFYNLDEEINDYYNTMITYYTNIAGKTYNTTLETYVNYVLGETLAAFQSEMQSVAKLTIEQHYALEYVAKEEKLKVTDDIYEKYIEIVMEENDYTDRATFETENSKDKIKEMILWTYARDVVFSYAKAE